MDQLVRLVDLAAECGLDVLVDGVQGHLSSFDFYPEWTRSWHHRNVFTDPEAIEAQALLLRTLGRALSGHPVSSGSSSATSSTTWSSTIRCR